MQSLAVAWQKGNWAIGSHIQYFPLSFQNHAKLVDYLIGEYVVNSGVLNCLVPVLNEQDHFRTKNESDFFKNKGLKNAAVKILPTARKPYRYKVICIVNCNYIFYAIFF